LGEDPKNPTTMGDLINQKDNEIKVLKKKLNIPDIHHVKTLELQAIHREKDQFYQQLVESRNIIEHLHAKNETMNVQQNQLLQASKSTIVQTTPLDSEGGLTKVMSYLSVKDIELGTFINKLRYNDARVTELEDQMKSK